MRYKEQEAIKETIDIINKHRQQKEEEEENEWPLRAIVLVNLFKFLSIMSLFFVILFVLLMEVLGWCRCLKLWACNWEACTEFSDFCIGGKMTKTLVGLQLFPTIPPPPITHCASSFLLSFPFECLPCRPETEWLEVTEKTYSVSFCYTVVFFAHALKCLLLLQLFCSCIHVVICFCVPGN